MVNPICTVNVSVLTAPAPLTLQSTGAFLSQGGTNLTAGETEILTQLSDLTALLPSAVPLSTITWSLNVATATSIAPHGFPIGKTVPLTVAGATPTGYNGTYNCTITGNTTFTYPLAVNPGAIVTAGNVTPADVAQLTAMATTFFAQGSNQSVYVLELGLGTVSDGVSDLSDYIGENPGVFYSYLVPREWDANADFLAFAATFEATTARTYFWVTSTLGTYTSYPSSMKSVNWLIESPTKPATEFSQAAPFHRSLSYRPSATNKVTPFAFSYLFGVTEYPISGNASNLAAIKTAHGNYIGTGAEGGISNLIELFGTMADGNDFTYWYSIDWVQLNIDQAISNAIINGSNNPTNPLYYNQQGINVLQSVAAGVMSAGVSNGLVLFGPTQTALDGAAFNANYNNGDYEGFSVVNAVPFLTYVGANPADYPVGTYNGLSCVFTPNRGFKSITFNVVVSNFPAQ